MPIVKKLIVIVGVAFLAYSMSRPSTKLEACFEVIDVMCDQIVDCDMIYNRESCLQMMKSDGFCRHEIESSVEDIKACAAEIRDMTCEDSLPQRCYDLH